MFRQVPGQGLCCHRPPLPGPSGLLPLESWVAPTRVDMGSVVGHRFTHGDTSLTGCQVATQIHC